MHNSINLLEGLPAYLVENDSNLEDIMLDSMIKQLKPIVVRVKTETIDREEPGYLKGGIKIKNHHISKFYFP